MRRFPAALIVAVACVLIASTAALATPSNDDELFTDELHRLAESQKVYKGGQRGSETLNMEVVGHNNLGGRGYNADVWVHKGYAYVGHWGSTTVAAVLGAYTSSRLRIDQISAGRSPTSRSRPAKSLTMHPQTGSRTSREGGHSVWSTSPIRRTRWRCQPGDSCTTAWPRAPSRGATPRSEERRVGKECRCRWSPY